MNVYNEHKWSLPFHLIKLNHYYLFILQYQDRRMSCQNNNRQQVFSHGFHILLYYSEHETEFSMLEHV